MPLHPAAVGDSSLAQGALVQTSLLARLLGIKLLEVEGTVLLSPARFESTTGSSVVQALPSSSGNGTRGTRSEPERVREHLRSETAPGNVIGARLGWSAQVLDETEAQLDELRTPGAGRRGDRTTSS